MPCNYLFKAEGEANYEHFIVPGCNSSVALSAVVGYFVRRNPEVRVSRWNEMLGSFPTVYCHLFTQGAGVFMEKFEIYIGKTRSIKDSTKPFTPDNIVEGTGFVAKSLEVNALGVLPCLREFMHDKE